MKKTLFALTAAIAATAVPGMAAAADEPAASPLTFNVGVVTDYRYRGISQSRLKPALQGGADYALPNGVYFGTWASTIKWIKDAGQIYSVDAGNTQFEWDFYGGYKGEIAKDVTYDVGGLYYFYPGNSFGNVPGGANANTFEIYGAVTYSVVTVKYSHALTNLFGNAGTKNSGYLDLSATFEVGPAIQLIPHEGYQRVAHSSDFSYTDYSFTVGKDFSGFFLSAAFVGADTKTIAGTKAYASPANGTDLGKGALVVAVKKTF